MRFLGGFSYCAWFLMFYFSVTAYFFNGNLWKIALLIWSSIPLKIKHHYPTSFSPFFLTSFQASSWLGKIPKAKENIILSLLFIEQRIDRPPPQKRGFFFQLETADITRPIFFWFSLSSQLSKPSMILKREGEKRSKNSSAG